MVNVLTLLQSISIALLFIFPSDVDRATVTLSASPRVILRDNPRDNRDKMRDDGRRVVRRRRINDIAVILENFDKPTLRSLLINKERRVGEVILVNGKPAIIRKRRVGPNDEDDIASDDLVKEKKASLVGGKKIYRSEKLPLIQLILHYKISFIRGSFSLL